jgi:hypothetical protein
VKKRRETGSRTRTTSAPTSKGKDALIVHPAAPGRDKSIAQGWARKWQKYAGKDVMTNRHDERPTEETENEKGLKDRWESAGEGGGTRQEGKERTPLRRHG